MSDPAIDSIQVIAIAISISPATRVALDVVERDAIRVTVSTAATLETPADDALYIVCVDASIAAVVAEGVAAWARRADPHPGLIGIVEAGTNRERETLLAAGFDDVIPAPLSAHELIARIRAVHRRVRRTTTSNGRLRFGPLTLDHDGHAVWVDGLVIALTSIELAVLRELMKARGKPLSRADLLDLAWGGGELDVSERAVDNVIMRLRRKLPGAELIETVRSVGFRIASNSPG